MSKQYPIPENDGEIALWPSAREMIRLIKQKRELPDWLLKVKEESLRELGFADHIAPIIMTGHQISLTHPGVWFKNAVISELAKKVNGHAVLIAIDTDAPKDLSLPMVPPVSPPAETGRSAMEASQSPTRTSAPLLPNLDVPWLGILGALWIPDLEKLREKTADPHLESFFELMKRNAAGKLPEQLLKTLFTLDLELGLNYTPILSSRLWELKGYSQFVKWFLNDPIKIASAYNQALGNNLIWPPLEISDNRCESPFWLDGLKTQRRQRLFLEKSGDQWRLEIGKERVNIDDPDALKQLNARLTPRAALNSIYLKTLADYFIHGVGGGQYDAVTNRFMQILGLPPIPFGVATATLYAPQAKGMKPINRFQIIQRIRHELTGWNDPTKRQWAMEMQTLPRKSDSRKKLFERMRTYLKDRETQNEVMLKVKTLQQELDQAQQLEKWMNRTLFHRIQPEERLRGLIDQILSNL